MCHLWARIRHGARWDRKEQTELALKALIASMKDVKSVEISMDPFHGDTTALREFWHKLTTPKIREANPRVLLNTEIRNDGKPPYFVMKLQDGKQLMFKTDGFHIADLLMRLNRLLGNAPLAPKGVPYEEEEEMMDYTIEDKIRERNRKKRPIDFLT